MVGAGKERFNNICGEEAVIRKVHSEINIALIL